MTFTVTPENYASLYAPLVYAFEDELEPRTVDVSIVQPATGEVIAVKRLSNTSSGRVDIAPLIRHLPTVEPARITGFSPANARMPLVRVEVDGATDTKRFLPAYRSPGNAVRLGSMPDERIISRGEYDELTLLPGVARAELFADTAAGMVLKSYNNLFSSVPVLFRFDPAQWDESVSQVEVQFLNTYGSLLSAVHYRVVPKVAESVRVAWLGRGGAVEHYTFPVQLAAAERQERRSLRMAAGDERLLDALFEERIEVVSAHEPQAVLRSLAELGTARFAWICDAAGEYRPVTAEIGEAILRRHGAPSALRFTLRPTQKNRMPWS